MQVQKSEGEIKFDTLVSRILLQDEKVQSPSTMQPVPLGLCTGKCPVFDNQSRGMPYPLSVLRNCRVLDPEVTMYDEEDPRLRPWQLLRDLYREA
jgi:hypothetical protein